MAEPATIARPYAEALFKSSDGADAQSLAEQLSQLGAIAGHQQLRRFADDPSVRADQVIQVLSGVAGIEPQPLLLNLLRAVIDNQRLAVLPEIAQQFHQLVSARSGVADARVVSAYPLDDTELSDLTQALERRFARKLKARVEVDPSLIGGIRVEVGDEVLDSSVKARLEQMKAALTR
jgi:F-type H+-transporting ATPase subunit delta